MTLTAFLLARIAEDEVFLASDLAEDARTCQECALASDFVPTPYTLERLRAECEAKRRMIADLEPDRGEGDYYAGQSYLYDGLLPMLAMPYTDHPDFDEEWKP